MFTNALSKNAADALAILGKSGILKDAYLAGGTACALQLGHRLSYDLDFFTDKEFSTATTLKQLEQLPGFKLSETEKWTILGSFPKVKFSYFYYPYPLVDKTAPFSKIRVASLLDIAAMKIAAICDRGTKRDFVDLYFIIENEISLGQILRFYDKKYGKLSNNLYHIMRSLQYFADAESQKVKMVKKFSWEEVKKFFQNQTIKLAKSKLKL